ncbi:4-hydroxy-tetrahydrodipicolinate reductase [Thalassotalea aquiviva]|uniref:4-hydroxy-tetrahydrodipicolinate reductase n=1 Tax=Thalassotalea aquiviva TaxID=3242415 RepID=UPI00352A2CFC
MLKVAILGCSGRMGRNLMLAALEQKNIELVGGLVRPTSSLVGTDAGEFCGCGQTGRYITNTIDDLIDADVFIDFSSIDAGFNHIAWCNQHKKALVIGTTGFNEQQVEQLKQQAKNIAVVLAPNTSIGVNLLFKLAELTAQVVGDEADIEIFEAHHRFKKDAPSGTAMRLGQVIADTLERDLDQCAVYGREGISEERDPKTIGFATIRAGDIIGEHTAFFANLGERIELTHKATSRMTFALGAMRAAKWVKNAPIGFYDMQDVLGLK